MFPLYISSVGILVCGAVSFAATDFRPVRNEQSNEEVLKTQLVLTAIARGDFPRPENLRGCPGLRLPRLRHYFF